MAYDLVPLRSYVRFYQSVVAQVTTAWDALVRTHETAQKALTPFAQPLAVVRSQALTEALAAPPDLPPAFRSLWRPQDGKDLSGLTDVYEVVGRFSFQGEDDENLAQIQAIVSSARNEIHVQRTRLAELAKLADTARSNADRLEGEEAKSAAERKAAKLAAFAPLTASLHQRAKQTMDAVRGVPVPPLADVRAAAEDYRAYAKKLDQVYQTCLPFLRKSIEDMYEFAGCEVPSSWPEHLPIQPELPEEFLMVPPSDSPELKRARSHVEALQKEHTELVAARDDVTVMISRLEGDLNSFHAKDAEAVKEIEQAGLLVNFATKLEEIDQIRRNLGKLEQQKSERTQRIGDLTQRTKTIETSIRALEQEMATRKQELAEAAKQLEVERDAEPAFIGKDAWRTRVGDLEQHIDNLRNAYAQREGMLNQLRIDMSSIGVQVQTEQSQSSLIDRWLADARSRERTLQGEAADLDKRLGAGRAIHTPTIAEAEHVLAEFQNARLEILERIERIKTDIRRNKEETAHILARMKQIEDERKKMDGFVQSAQVAATQGFEEAMRQLAARRRAAVIHHVEEVLGELEKSLNSVDAVFVEPAKAVMLKADEPVGSIAARVREHADKLEPIAQALFSELDPDLLEKDAMMGQVQREFCDAAPEACRNAWG
jgi:DNA repair exonuclease SbcCD ATPase subunit